jgi:polyferredoxin
MRDDNFVSSASLPVNMIDPASISRGTPGKLPSHSRPKKLPLALRKPRLRWRKEHSPVARVLMRIREDSQFLRAIVQVGFLLLCVWIGIEFYLFIKWGTSPGVAPFVQRPPGAEGFLPISALISAKYFILTGIINTIHPAGFAIFIAILVISFLGKKAFCSWLCPIGTISESLWQAGKKLFGRNVALPRWIDTPLRGLKYLLLLFFFAVIWQMDSPALRSFIESPYNRVADIKMYYFFAHISSAALWTILVLIVLSLFVKNFWCRYLCPYGGLLGIISLASPFKVSRSTSSCIDCSLCTKVCPSRIPVHRLTRVRSDECMQCLECVQVCPVKDTLEVRPPRVQTRITPWVFGMLVIGLFMAITGLAMLTGHWKNSIGKQEYLHHFQQIDSPLYSHESAIRQHR